MKSKISCFNKTIFMKNFTRFWPMWALYLVILFFLMPMNLYLQTHQLTFNLMLDQESSKFSTMVSCVENGMRINIVLTFLFAIACAILMFSYLFHTNSSYMTHALPVRRKELYLTNYLSGILFLIVPQILAFLMTLVTCIINDVTCVEYLLHWLLVSLASSFLFYSLASFCCMLTGNAFAALVYYIIGNLIYIGIKYLLITVVEMLCYGIESYTSGLSEIITSKDGFFSPLIFLIASIGYNYDYDPVTGILTSVSFYGTGVIVIYLVIGVIAAIAAWLFYRARHLECAGDIVTFRWMNPIFRWVIAFCFGLGISLILTNVFFYQFNNDAPVMMCFTGIFTLVCFFISEMILKKSFRIFTGKRWLEAIICAVAAFLLILGLEKDLFHIERRVPDAQNVKIASLDGSSHGMVFTDPEDIQKVIDLHQNAIDHKTEYEDFYYHYWNGEMEDATDMQSTAGTFITYYLNNGTSFTRYYDIPVTRDALSDPDSSVYKLSQIQNNPEAYLQCVICKNYEDVTYESGYIDFPSVTKDGQAREEGYTLSGYEAEQLYHAIEQDILEGNYPIGPESIIYPQEDHYYSSFSLTGRVENASDIYDIIPDTYKHKNSGAYAYNNNYYEDDGKSFMICPNFELFTSCTHTIQALIDLGIIESEDDLIPWTQYDEIMETYGVG